MNFSLFVLYALDTLFVLNATMLVVLFVGWLTHANYYYVIYKKIDDVGIFMYSVFTGILTFLGTIGYFFDASLESLYRAITMITGLWMLGVLLFVVLNYTYNYLMKVHEYFGNKRGM